MLLSHKYKFIFIKVRKTAGTSFEIALSEFLGAADVIAEISPDDEALRQSLGFRTAQNHLAPWHAYGPQDWWRLARERRHKRRFINHIPAEKVRRRVGPKIWDEYYKFCFERNPWDKVISSHAWRTRNGDGPGLSEFIMSDALLEVPDHHRYMSDGKIIVDDIFRYEALNDSLSEIARRLELPETPKMPRTKGHARKTRKPYRECIGSEERKRIDEVFAWEIQHFGYEF